MSAKDLDDMLGIVRPESVEETAVEVVEAEVVEETVPSRSDLLANIDNDEFLEQATEVALSQDAELEVEDYQELETKDDKAIAESIDTHIENTSKLTQVLTDAFHDEVQATNALPGAHQLQALSKVLDSANNAIKLKVSINEAKKNRHFKDKLSQRTSRAKVKSGPSSVTIAQQNVNGVPSRSEIIASGKKNITRAKQKVAKAQDKLIDVEPEDDNDSQA
jgi:hypothetical protein